MKTIAIPLILTAAVGLTACGTTTGSRTGSGALMGAAGGAAIGSLSGSAGTGALTLPLLDAGVEVWAVERDPVWSKRLRQSLVSEAYATALRGMTRGFRRSQPA